MSVEHTPATVTATLSQIARAIQEQSHAVAELDEAAVRARAAHKSAFARAFLTTDGSMDVRRYTAEQNTADLFLEAELSEQVLRAGREALRVLRDRLEVGRSIGSQVRLEWNNS